MKKLSVHILILSAFVALGCVSCQDVIFDTIREEVELEDSQVSGDINSIIRYAMNTEVKQSDGTTKTEEHEFLFVDNGNIWYKDVTHKDDGTENPTNKSPYSGKWVPGSESGISSSHVIRLAADSTYLYALGASVEANNDSGYMEPTGKVLYSTTDAKTWTAVEGLTLEKSSATPLFCTNTPKKETRKAYIRSGSVIYELNGTSATALTTTEVSATWNFSSKPTAFSTDTISVTESVSFSANSTSSSDTITLNANKGNLTYYSDGYIQSGSNADCTDKDAFEKADTTYTLSIPESAGIIITYSGISDESSDKGVFAVKSPSKVLTQEEVTGQTEATYTVLMTASEAGDYTIYANKIRIYSIEISNGFTTSAKHVVLLGSDTLYFSANPVTSNATKDADSTAIYYAKDSTIYHSSDASSWTGVKLSSDTINTLAYTPTHILVGTTKGLTTAPLTQSTGIPTGSTEAMANSSSTLSSYYSVFSILAVDPSLDASTGDAYATTTFSGSASSTAATSTNTGLWSYYPGRNNWNRE